MNQEITTENTETRKHTEGTEQPHLTEQPMLPSVEELAAENETLRFELRMRSAVYDIEMRLAKAGARSPGLLAEQAKASFQFTEEGELANPEAVIERLRKTWPDQFTPDPVPSIDASAGRTVRPPLTKEALARMTPAEIQRLDWAEVKAALAQ